MNRKWMVAGLVTLALAMAGCGEASNQASTAGSTSTSSSSGGQKYGPACRENVYNANCVEEEEAKNKPIEERAQKEQEKALNQMHEEEAKEGAEEAKEMEENHGPAN